ncbi:MAG TPA: DUF2065 family protein [Gammaproteobacteria bacterium]|nr:DUF2065 family protein [Gammaproteobacteria bacterium]
MAFYLIIEGLFPFVTPRSWRRGLAALGRLEDNQLRGFGLAAVITGLVLLLLIRG